MQRLLAYTKVLATAVWNDTFACKVPELVLKAVQERLQSELKAEAPRVQKRRPAVEDDARASDSPSGEESASPPHAAPAAASAESLAIKRTSSPVSLGEGAALASAAESDRYAELCRGYEQVRETLAKMSPKQIQKVLPRERRSTSAITSSISRTMKIDSTSS